MTWNFAKKIRKKSTSSAQSPPANRILGLRLRRKYAESASAYSKLHSLPPLVPTLVRA